MKLKEPSGVVAFRKPLRTSETFPLGTCFLAPFYGASKPQDDT